VFTKIQDGYCQSCLDGVDEEFSVTKDNITYSFYNGSGDEHYKQMQGFFDAIIDQVKHLEFLAGFQ